MEQCLFESESQPTTVFVGPRLEATAAEAVMGAVDLCVAEVNYSQMSPLRGFPAVSSRYDLTQVVFY